MDESFLRETDHAFNTTLTVARPRYSRTNAQRIGTEAGRAKIFRVIGSVLGTLVRCVARRRLTEKKKKKKNRKKKITSDNATDRAKRRRSKESEREAREAFKTLH